MFILNKQCYMTYMTDKQHILNSSQQHSKPGLTVRKATSFTVQSDVSLTHLAPGTTSHGVPSSKMSMSL